MTKLNIVLAIALVASALMLVKTSHEARVLYAAVDRAKSEQTRLEVEAKRIDAEMQQQAASLNVERKARDRLRMRPTDPAVTQYVQDAAPSSATTPVAAPLIAPAGTPVAAATR